MSLSYAVAAILNAGLRDFTTIALFAFVALLLVLDPPTRLRVVVSCAIILYENTAA